MESRPLSPPIACGYDQECDPGVLGLGTHLFVKVSRPGDSEVTC